MSDLWNEDPSEAWGIPLDLDEAYWQCACGSDTYNPNENTHCFACGKKKPAEEVISESRSRAKKEPVERKPGNHKEKSNV